MDRISEASQRSEHCYSPAKGRQPGRSREHGPRLVAHVVDAGGGSGPACRLEPGCRPMRAVSAQDTSASLRRRPGPPSTAMCRSWARPSSIPFRNMSCITSRNPAATTPLSTLLAARRPCVNGQLGVWSGRRSAARRLHASPARSQGGRQLRRVFFAERERQPGSGQRHADRATPAETPTPTPTFTPAPQPTPVIGQVAQPRWKGDAPPTPTPAPAAPEAHAGQTGGLGNLLPTATPLGACGRGGCAAGEGTA